MPITTTHSIKPLSQQSFHELDYAIMGMAFDMHNQLGRFYNEKIYQNELMRECMNKGFDVQKELEIKLIHKDYSKSLFIDLLINGCVYELKTIQSIQEIQRTQTLDYLFATNTQHGKIINFHPASIEHEFVSTTLNKQQRHEYEIKCNRWYNASENTHVLKESMINLITDWGAFLNINLYEKALIHLIGGEEKIVRPIEIKNNNQTLGFQKFNMISDSEVFILSATRNNISQHEKNLKKLLSHTPCKYLHWINLNHSEIQFITLNK